MSDTIDKVQPTPQQQEKQPPSLASPRPAPLYSFTFFSKEAAEARKGLIPDLVVPVIYNAILLCACLALFLGSLIKANDISNIAVAVVNLDDGEFGAGLIKGIEDSLKGPGPHLRWSFVDAADVAGGYDAWSRDVVLDERAWALLLVAPNASVDFERALGRGEEEYDPSTAARLYFASARNQVVTMSLTVPAVMDLADGILSRIARNATARYLGSGGRVSEIRCPQCLVSPFTIQQVDLVPFSSSIALGPLSTGLIFLLTSTFQFFTILHSGASTYGSLLSLPSTLSLRTTLSLTTYLLLSLTYSLLLLAFSLPLTGLFPHSPTAGFTTLWALHFLTMAACGFVLEATCTLSGMAFAPFVLNVWLILNASPGFGARETMPEFYRYGYAMPFWHAGQATRTIVFGTKSHLGVNFGVLGAWVVGGWGAVCWVTSWRIGRAVRRGVHYVP